METQMTVEELATEWLEIQKTKLPEETIEKYKFYIDDFVVENLGVLWLFNVETSTFLVLYRYLLEEGLLGRSQVKELNAILKDMFEYAVEGNLIESNPLKGVVPVKVPRGEFYVWTRQETRTFLETTRGSNYYIAFFLGITTGVTLGEVVALRWDDVDFDKKTIHVRNFSDDGGKTLRETTLKERRLLVPDNVIDELKEEKERQEARLLQSHENYVAVSANGNPLHSRNVSRSMANHIEKSGVTAIRFLDLRHTHIVRLLENGVPFIEIVERMGYKNSAFLDKYHKYVNRDISLKLDVL